jgi:hypothetical protein
MNPLKFFAAIGITTTTCSAQTTAQDARRTGPLSSLHFQREPAHPDFKNSAKASLLLFHFGEQSARTG